jgi:hypothetical protein
VAKIVVSEYIISTGSCANISTTNDDSSGQTAYFTVLQCFKNGTILLTELFTVTAVKLSVMKKYISLLPFLLFILLTGLTGCEAIAGIFKAGMWTGIIIVVLVIVLIIWLISRTRK